MDTTADKILRDMQAYDLKQLRSGEYECNSPLRPGANSHSFHILIEDGEHGTFHDKVSGQSGSLYELASLRGIETPKRVPVENSKRAYATLAEYAAFKGVPEEAFAAAGWKETTSEGRPCFEFQTAGGIRRRFTDGEKPSFKSATGFKARWYGLDRAVKQAGDNKQPLVMCNGEPSTIVAQHFGLNAFCLPGGENQTMTPELLSELKGKWNGEILVALDCDKAGSAGASRIQSAFAGAGVKHRVIDLMLSDKGDLADFCKLHTSGALDALKKCPNLFAAKAPAQAAQPENLNTLLKQLVQARKSETADDVPALLDRIQTEVNLARSQFSVTPLIPAKDLIDAYHERLDRVRAGVDPRSGYLSGIPKIDKITGRMKPGRIYVYLAETGMGKSTLTASIASNLLNGTYDTETGEKVERQPGLVVPTESLPLDFINRVIAHRTHIPTDRLDDAQLTDEEYTQVAGELGHLGAQTCHVLDAQNPTTDAIRAAALSGIVEHGYKWLLMDSASNVKGSDARSLFDNTVEVMDCAQELARHGMVVILTSQVGRNLEGRDVRIPERHDGKGSGRIEENADVLMALYNHNELVNLGKAEPDAAFPVNTLFTRCLKHRHKGGMVGKWANLALLGGCGVY